VRGVDWATLDMDAGETFGVIGWSGAGKSTLAGAGQRARAGDSRNTTRLPEYVRGASLADAEPCTCLLQRSLDILT